MRLFAEHHLQIDVQSYAEMGSVPQAVNVFLIRQAAGVLQFHDCYPPYWSCERGQCRHH